MVKNLYIFILGLLGVTAMFVSACSPTAAMVVTATPGVRLATPMIQPTATLTPTSTITLTPAPTETPTITPTPVGGGSGKFIYTDGWGVFSYNLSAKNSEKLSDNCVWYLSVSMDGHYLICSEYKQDGVDNPGAYGITMIDLVKKKVVKTFLETAFIGRRTRFLMADFFIHTSEISPDNAQIAFIGTVENKSGIFIINVGTSAYKLIYESPLVNGLVWSPDGSRLIISVYSSDSRSSSTSDYLVVDQDGSNLVKIFTCDLWPIKWGKDSNTVFIQNTGMDVKTQEWNGDKIPSPYLLPSPDGKYQVDLDSVTTGHNIHIKSMDNGKLKVSIPWFEIRRSHWSADSKFLLYFTYDKPIMYSMDIHTLKSTVILKMKGVPNILWLPDGSGFIFSQEDGNGGYEVGFSDIFGKITNLANPKYSTSIYLLPEAH